MRRNADELEMAASLRADDMTGSSVFLQNQCLNKSPRMYCGQEVGTSSPTLFFKALWAFWCPIFLSALQKIETLFTVELECLDPFLIKFAGRMVP